MGNINTGKNYEYNSDCNHYYGKFMPTKVTDFVLKSGMHELTDEVLVFLRRVIRATDLYSRRLGKKTGLTTPQLVIMRAISSRGSPTVSEIGREVSLSQATVTSILNRLEQNLLIERKRNQEDKRAVNVHLSTKGKRLLATAPQPLQEGFIKRFSSLADWEQYLIVSSLARVAEMMDAEELDAAPLLASGDKVI